MLRQGWDFVAPQVSRLVGPEPTAGTSSSPPLAGDTGGPPPFAGAQTLPWQPPPSVDRLGALMQALQQRQIPPLPVPGAMGAPATPQADGLGLLALILANPQFQYALQQAAATGGGPVTPVALPVPAAQPPSRMRSLDIPLGAVINAIAALTSPALMQLNARTTESDPEVPEYLVSGDGEFVVDPASAEERAALVVHMFELSDEAQRLAALERRQSRPDRADTELDEADAWARDVGLL